MPGLVESYERVRKGIIAFAPKYPEMIRAGAIPFEFIFGTGFVVSESLVATNAHVVEEFKNMPGYTDSDKAVVAIIFVRRPGGMAPILLNVTDGVMVKGVKTTGAYFGPARPDIGIAALDCKGLADFVLPLKLDAIAEGAAVATSGFPMGPLLLHLEGQLDHISPTLQTGVISATLPFPGAKPHGYLMNVMVQGGASGSPVFLSETGEVIGLINSRLYEDGKMTPTNFANVVPSFILNGVLQQSRTNLLRSVPPSAPNLAEILATMPDIPNPTQKMTRGTHISHAKPGTA